MKLSEIKIGDEYACASGGHARRSPGRFRVVAKGVTGLHRVTSWTETVSKPTMVEIEPIGDGYHGGLPWRADVKVLLHDLPADGWLSAQKAGDPYVSPRGEERRKVETRKALRVSSSCVVRPWAEQEQRIEEAEQSRKRYEHEKHEREKRTKTALKTINKACGLNLSGWPSVSLDVDDLEAIAKAIEARHG